MRQESPTDVARCSSWHPTNSVKALKAIECRFVGLQASKMWTLFNKLLWSQNLNQQSTAKTARGGWWRWALVSADGEAPSRMVGVSASVNLPLHYKVQKFSSGTSSHGWSWKKGRKTVVCMSLPHHSNECKTRQHSIQNAYHCHVVLISVQFNYW